jgi:hypothetical protein
MKKKIWAAAACAVLALLAGCKNSGTAQNSTDMRALHAVADAEPLDILVDDDVKVSGLAFGATSSYSEFSSGTRDVKVRSTAATTVLTDKSLSFSSGAAATLLVYGKRNALLTQLIADDTTAPASGHFRVRVVNLAPDSGAVDLYLTPGDISSSAAAITATGYGVVTGSAEITSGSLRVSFTSSGTQDVLFQSAPFAFSDGSSITVALIPSLGGKLANAIVLTSGRSGTATLLQNPLARVKAVNAIADSTGLNFKADGTTLLSSVPFMGSSSYVTTATGTHALQIEASNIPGTVIASVSRALDPARDYTLLAAGSVASPQLIAIADDNSLPVSGFAKLRFVDALGGQGSVDVLVNFASQASRLAYGAASSYYQLAPSTTYTITFATPGGITVLATLTPAELDAGGVYTAYLFGAQGSAQVRLVRDR